MTKAAGILFVSKTGTALFLRRTATAPDCPGCWDFPGGGQEGDESADLTALREAREEIGFVPEGVRVLHTRTKSGSAPKGVADLAAPVVGAPVDSGAATAPPPAMPVDVDFTTFLQRVTAEFTPELNDEHDGYAWAPIDSPPEPLHPGCRIALDRLSMNELDVARAMAAGQLTSPQRYENVWLWAIRISGIGASFRPKHEEFVHRDGESWLTPDAIARANGLPVIFKHPQKALLNSDEFKRRIVGTIFLPYVAQDELWGIAKIYDHATSRLLEDEDLSTSPGVNFSDPKVNRVLKVEGVGKVLVEGEPSLFDHVAICELGVWDKGGEPTGIRSESREDSAAMADDKKEETKDAKKDAAMEVTKADDSKKDAKADAKKDEFPEKKEEKKEEAKDDAAKVDMGAVMDAVKSCADAVSGLGKRMDAWEEKEKSSKDDARKDAKKDDEETGAEKTAADKKDSKKDARKDESEEKKEEKREDSRADSVAVSDRIARVEAAVRQTQDKIVPLSDDDHSMVTDAWARADDVCVQLGMKTPRHMPGESSIQYRRRLVGIMKPYSKTWKDVDPKAYADDAAFNIAESQIFSEAAFAANMPVNVNPGQLRMTEKTVGGHTIRDFKGEPRAWMDQFAGQTGLKAEGRWLHDNLGNRAN
jgi:8-oxo-dGTP pyrophosphatase MutT (NUDIX family)